MKKNKRVMVFGVFDRLHEGHRSFLKQARKHGKELIVVVARDAMVRELKHRTPSQTERQRMAALRRVSGVWKVILGDKKQGTYGVVKKWKPDIICMGYDQKSLRKDISKRFRTSHIIILHPYQSEKFHTLLLT